jgi:hypothetical protein
MASKKSGKGEILNQTFYLSNAKRLNLSLRYNLLILNKILSLSNE